MSDSNKILLQETQIADLVKSSSLESVCAVEVNDGFELIVTSGPARFNLGTSRGKVRVFSSLNTVSTFLQRIGIYKFTVDSSKDVVIDNL